MIGLLTQPFLLGLSAGVFCLTYCAPFIAPFMVLEEREKKENFKVILKFIFGRFFGYLLFGAFFGYLGEKIDNAFVDLIFTIALMILSIILIFYALGLLKEKLSLCPTPRVRNTTPLVMGFLMGVNICPPFLMSLTYVLTLHSWLSGVIYFFMFFLGTTVYFLPLTFLGFLNRMKEFRVMARVSGVLVGFMFLIYGAYNLWGKF
jgi:sulfite exporter TauE/SafE